MSQTEKVGNTYFFYLQGHIHSRYLETSLLETFRLWKYWIIDSKFKLHDIELEACLNGRFVYFICSLNVSVGNKSIQNQTLKISLKLWLFKIVTWLNSLLVLLWHMHIERNFRQWIDVFININSFSKISFFKHS